MSNIMIPQDYHTPLSVYEMQRAIEFIKSNFQVNLSNALNLRRVSAPLFVDENSGLNDNLNGVERPVSFDIPDVGVNAQVVHSLAKWKRLALKRYQFNVGKGLFTDMNAIRRDEELDNLHSIYVDQWDWEKVISADDRNVAYLKRTVRDIVAAVSETSSALNVAFPSLRTKLPSEVFFITTQELEDLYPDLTPKQREDEICKKKGVVFLMQIGKTLRSGIKQTLAEGKQSFFLSGFRYFQISDILSPIEKWLYERTDSRKQPLTGIGYCSTRRIRPPGRTRKRN